jgi:hypothetical protein
MATDTHEDTQVSARTQEWVNQVDLTHAPTLRMRDRLSPVARFRRAQEFSIWLGEQLEATQLPEPAGKLDPAALLAEPDVARVRISCGRARPTVVEVQLDPFHPDRAAAIRAMCAPVEVEFIGRIP